MWNMICPSTRPPVEIARLRDIAALLALMLVTALLFASAAQATPISATVLGYDLVKVGDPGNLAQASGNASQIGYGAVATDFWIGKNHVTIGQYAEFLNAVAKTNDRGLYNNNMNIDQEIRGVVQTGVSGSFVYTVVGPNGTNPTGAQSPANRPITFVSWFDSARFANWMANGKPTGAAGSTTTDNGAYNLGTATTGNAPALNIRTPTRAPSRRSLSPLRTSGTRRPTIVPSRAAPALRATFFTARGVTLPRGMAGMAPRPWPTRNWPIRRTIY